MPSALAVLVACGLLSAALFALRHASTQAISAAVLAVVGRLV